MYKFNDQNRIGKEGEKILNDWLKSKYEIANVSEIKSFQKVGIDCILTNEKEQYIKLEYKFDNTAQRTGNIFFETVSIDNYNVPGWGFSSQADYWIFLIPPENILIFKPAQLRLFLWQNRHKVKEKRIKNKGYYTLGYPLKLTLIKPLAYCVTNLQQIPPNFT